MRNYFYFAIYLWVISASILFAQQKNEESVLLDLKIGYMGTLQIAAIIKDSTAYLPVKELFNNLGIKSEYDSTSQRLTGFFKSTDTTYTINLQDLSARIAKRKYTLTQNDFLIHNGLPYLKMDFINKFYGTELNYKPRKLLVEVNNSLDLPSVKYIMRNKILNLAKTKKTLPAPDIILGRETNAFAGTRLDWDANNQFSKTKFISSRYTLSLGAKMFGGDFNGKLFDYILANKNQQTWHANYRYPIDNSSILKQITVGDLVNHSFMPREITGFEITNRPFEVRRVFTRDVFHGQFDPDMNVALSNGLEGAQIIKTDNLGYYTIDAPVLYGDGMIEIKAFDPWGQERTLRYRMVVPNNFIPPGEIEYTVSLGRIRPPSNMVTENTYINWGISKHLTGGLLMDYYDYKNPGNKFFPGLTASARFLSDMIFYAAFTPRVAARTNLIWRLPSHIDFSFTDNIYQQNAYFNPAKITHDIRTSLLVPYNFSGAQRLLFDFSGERTFYQNYRTDVLQFAIAGANGVFSSRISSQLIWQKLYNSGVNRLAEVTNVSVGFVLPAHVFLGSEVDFNHLTHEITSINVSAVKSFINSFQLGFYFNRLPNIGYYNAMLRLSYNFPFMHLQTIGSTTGSQQYRYQVNGYGSVSFDMVDKALYFMNQTHYSGYGGIKINPFFDENGNGIIDKEDKEIHNGRLYYSNLSKSNSVTKMPADVLNLDRTYGYDEYLIYLDRLSLENPLWFPRFQSIRMLSEPNHVRQVNIPIVIGGFVRGKVKIITDNEIEAEGIDMIMTAVREGEKDTTQKSLQASTFSTGEYEFGPVAPGKYRIEVFPEQTAKLGYFAEPRSRDIEITSKPDGDIINNIDFRLKKR